MDNISEDNTAHNINSFLIPEKYRETISKIAESIDSGFICHINNDTLQYIEVPNDDYGALDTEELDEFTTPVDEWENYITIEPLPSNVVFTIMEKFAGILDDKKFAEKLKDKLQKRKTLRNLKYTIENSPFKERWFDFKRKQLIQHVYKILLENNMVQD